MLKSLFSVGKGSKDKGPSDNGFVKAKTGGITSQATVLVNDTNNTLYLRDKVGAAYGNTRYKIPGKSQIEVSPLQHTFFKMLAYAVEEGSDGKETKAESPGNPQTQKKTSTDTKLTIDSDQLSDNKRITITWEDSKYKLKCLPR